MRRLSLRWLALLFLLCFATVSTLAGSISYTGTLTNPESYEELTFTVGGSPQTVDLQTWGFGGGTNANTQVISPGGFDPLLALFFGVGPGASLINGTSDISGNFPSFMGCGPAGTVAFSNGDSVCGDITMSFSLFPGTYTLILSDAGLIPNAFSDPNPNTAALGEGFTDLTGGVFQTCDTNKNGMSCITPTNAWAFDITGTMLSGLSLQQHQVPEPGVLLQLALSLLLLLGFGQFQRAKRRHPIRD